MKNGRKWAFRLGTLLIFLLIAVVMMIIGRGHTVYFDNKTLEYNGQTYSAFQRAEIYVGEERVARLSKKERGMASNMGQTFTCSIDITENKGDEPVHHDITLKLPYSVDGIVVNLPGYFAGLPEEAWSSVFVPQVVTETEEEEVTTDEFDVGEF